MIPVKSAARALEVLSFFEERRQPATVAEVSASLGIPKPSTLPLLKTMESHGYLLYERKSGTFFPTLKVRALGSWLKEDMYLDERTLRLVEAVHRVTGETVSLARESGISTQVFHVLTGTHPITYRVELGARYLLPETAVGLAILSTKSDDDARKTLDKLKKKAKSPGRGFDVAAVLAKTAKARRAGYAAAYNVNIEGAGGVAVPLPARDRATYVLCVWGLADRIRKHEKRIVEQIRSEIARAGLAGAEQLDRTQ
jgi:DNA-binding IclR family transcriptional regulator